MSKKDVVNNVTVDPRVTLKEKGSFKSSATPIQLLGRVDDMMLICLWLGSLWLGRLCGLGLSVQNRDRALVLGGYEHKCASRYVFVFS